jgi:hypothetical protein
MRDHVTEKRVVVDSWGDETNSAILLLNRFEVTVEPRLIEAHQKHIFQFCAALSL